MRYQKEGKAYKVLDGDCAIGEVLKEDSKWVARVGFNRYLTVRPYSCIKRKFDTREKAAEALIEKQGE